MCIRDRSYLISTLSLKIILLNFNENSLAKNAKIRSFANRLAKLCNKIYDFSYFDDKMILIEKLINKIF